tara:strand:- start:10535 stop:11377 length:843 start_codon:yes stop_codon:yes gene_type:complete
MSAVAIKRNGVECYKLAKIGGVNKQSVGSWSGVDSAPPPKFFSMFEDGSGTESADLSLGTTAHDAEFVGACDWYTTSTAAGTYAIATGTGEAIKIDDHSDLDWPVTGEWSFSTYTATLSSTYAGCLVKRTGSGSAYRGFALYFLNGVIDCYIVDAYSSEALHVKGTGTSTNIKDGNWHHVVVSWDGTGSQDSSALTMWIDGVKHTVGNGKLAVHSGIDTLDSDSVITNSVDIYLSNSSDTQVYPSGGVDHTAIWNGTGLTATQVAVLYNSGTPIDVRRGL